MRPIILASSSPYRRKLLELLRVQFETIDPAVDEDEVKARGLPARELVEELSILKARSVLEHYPDAIVIGSDQCVELDGEILGKPGSAEKALEQLLKMSGRTHLLWTGVAVASSESERVATHVDKHVLTMRRLDAETLERYVVADEPYDCAGSYRIESLGISLFERVESEDFTAITGLPLTVVVRMLDRFGVSVP